MNEEVFLNQYKKLNKYQKEAVDAIDGPVMVVAGPGTGKTSILTLRIANILKMTDTSPDSILALTFTEAGVQAMRKKLLAIIGSSAHKVNIHTFHGFCNGVIQEFPERFPRIIGSKNISDLDQIRIIENIILGKSSDSGNLSKLSESGELNKRFVLLKPWGEPLHYVSRALSEIQGLKRDAISVENFRKAIEEDEKELSERGDVFHEKGPHKGKKKGEVLEIEKNIAKNKELLLIYEEYEKALEKEKLYDYADMIVEVVKVMKEDSDLLLILQEKYQYILADEHQDANDSQNAILELLSNFHENPNLFIVGDEKQAIFRFQGASLKNFLYFKKIYSNALLVNLEDNYRSTQYILDAAHSLIERNNSVEMKRIKLKANTDSRLEKMKFLEFSRKQNEIRYIAELIEDLLKKKVKSEEIAVIYRENRDAFGIADALSRAGISYRIESDRNLLDDYRISSIIKLFEIIDNPIDEKILGEVLLLNFLNLSRIDTFKIIKYSTKYSGKPIHEIIRSKDILKEIGISNIKDFLDFGLKFDLWLKLSNEKSFPELFEIVMKESGYLKNLLDSENYLENMNVLNAFYSEVRDMSGGKNEYFLKDFISYIKVIKDHGLLIKGSVSNLETGKVKLLTAHRSKGLEFEYVIISGANSKKWEARRAKTTFKLPQKISKSSESSRGVEDERRLFYVALTRAKKEVFIMSSKIDTDGREDIRSEFIDEIDGEVIELVSSEKISKIEEKYSSDLTYFFERKDKKIREDDAEYIKKTFIEQELSVTHLNNYLECPWRYFFVNLLRIPQSQSKYQLYGTAIHETLETYFNKYKEDKILKTEEVLKIYEYELNRLTILKSDYDELLNNGREALNGYLKTYEGTWNKNLLTEYIIKGVSISTSIKYGGEKISILLNGKLDKIEFLSDNSVNVVDYKTGRSKSENEIKGLTKTGNGDYYRQLIFYKLLLDLDKKKGLKMEKAELDFIEPDEKGRNKKFSFIIEDKEVDDLKNIIENVAKEIIELEFWNRGCDKKDCEYCKLKEDLKNKI